MPRRRIAATVLDLTAALRLAAFFAAMLTPLPACYSAVHVQVGADEYVNVTVLPAGTMMVWPVEV